KKYHGEASRLVMGDRNHVREFASISLGTEGGGMETVVGSDNLFMNNSHVGHDCRIGNHVVLANGVPLAGHVLIDDHAIVSGRGAGADAGRIHRSQRAGRQAAVRWRASSRVSG